AGKVAITRFSFGIIATSRPRRTATYCCHLGHRSLSRRKCRCKVARESDMSGTRLPKSLFVVILGAAFAECIRDFPLLPNRLASHFGPSGTPSGWLTKPQFFTLYAGLIVLVASVGFLAPRMIAKTPASKINLPYKEYWLAPERRVETFASFERYFAWYACVFL